ncbi:carbonic anhydrase [Streptoalloteichus tenebrarius]|uniref:Carbonic anhydrase n=1 Tax=Streptoalloteichus tenebrarius (strain ATCC 17920 / DSM 40477 / JCM 4838 / CBS 697.72 / NBRC 16177 / NCIMB 11028 / NRRL B-12390 / A12253. 1 / ISP 5477) TaxID=1933 RepID=A0ABT1HSB9_STRSD|nr:carbonic anhydrase [Streptoalloteichus tenebrarius]MCP2258406.1 carbonic anhydrase [Streptoalloteichus tenebrarius]BFF03576.1 carbonic anhydrase [Streptoalloteichus tenebrarius]
MTFEQLVENARAHQARIPVAQRRRLAAGQSPVALFITCSDSRVVPTLITGAAPGQLFELRTAGNIVPPYQEDRPSSEIATIEFAVEELGVSDVVVCGHSHCGAVAARQRIDQMDRLPAVRDWLRLTTGRPGAPVAESDPAVREAARRHLAEQLATLADYPFVRSRVERGDLRLHGWFYELDTGVVWSCPPGAEPAEPALQPL